MDRGAVAAGSHVEPARVFARIGNEIGYGVYPKCLGFLGVHHHDVWHTGDQGDGGKVFLRVIRQFGIQGFVDPVRTHCAHQQGVAVRRCSGDEFGADVAACTAFVFDYK